MNKLRHKVQLGFSHRLLCTSKKSNWFWQNWIHKIFTKGYKEVVPDFFIICNSPLNKGKSPKQIWTKLNLHGNQFAIFLSFEVHQPIFKTFKHYFIKKIKILWTLLSGNPWWKFYELFLKQNQYDFAEVNTFNTGIDAPTPAANCYITF